MNSPNQATIAAMEEARMMTSRLGRALLNLGYDKPTPPHWRSNLVSAIRSFAIGTNDTDLEAECEAELARIRAEIAAGNTTA